MMFYNSLIIPQDSDELITVSLALNKQDDVTTFLVLPVINVGENSMKSSLCLKRIINNLGIRDGSDQTGDSGEERVDQETVKETRWVLMRRF